MSRITRPVVLLLSLSLGLSAGCSDDQAGMGEQDQYARSAADRIAELERELADARRGRGATEDRLMQLQDERDALQRKLDELRAGQQGEWLSVPGGAMVALDGTVLFDSGRAELRPEAKSVLDQVMRVILQQYADHDIYVFGHTDNDPISVSGWTDNYELSCQRALSVLRYLQSRGGTLNMMAGGWGENRPMAANVDDQSKQMNRRVEIYAIRAMDAGYGSVDARRN